ncbi:phosphatase PAP2 family protein [Sphingomonas sp.]|uniref:phosphatase PAP2 family protein n=1 Tax=Sphingomonas sp. TaxID=28214 RepID=UPI002DEC2F9D|nr:phosphatase PAP2 family protein [Sphingomonas sp.]
MNTRLIAAALLFAGVFILGFWLKLGGHPAIDPWLSQIASAGRDRSGFWLSLSQFGQSRVVGALAVLAAIALWMNGRGRAAVVLVAVVAVQISTNALLKLLFARSRPDLFEHLDLVNDLSYPSGHSAQNACFYLLLALILHRHTAWVGVPLLLLIGTSRVVLGVHWPSDVIGGWMEGVAFALVGAWLVDANVLRRRPER